jgi:hypothetical protein
LADEYVGEVTILTQVIMYNQNFLQVDQPIRLQYSNQIKLLPTINVTCFIWFIGYFYQLADPRKTNKFSGNNPRAFTELPYHLVSNFDFHEEPSVKNKEFFKFQLN